MKRFFYVAVSIVCVCGVIASLTADIVAGKAMYARAAGFHVVIDAGHGGHDGGASSPRGVSERDINLTIAKYLKYELESRGIGVTLTRENEHSLANPYAKNQKKSDMDARRKIIERVVPDLVVSIHLNSLPSSSGARGLQTFYSKNVGDEAANETSKNFAKAIQDKFNESSLNINRRPFPGDYYILNCTKYPSVLVECGFLSNPSDERLLKTDSYQRLLAGMIAEVIANSEQV